MDDLISKQEVIDLLKQMRKDGNMVPWEGKDVFARIRKLPPAQPEIIRCRECKFARLTNDGSCKYCDIWFPDEAEYMDGDYYCASAERREVTT